MNNYLDIDVVIKQKKPGAYSVRVASDEGEGSCTLTLPFTLADLSGAVFGVAESARAIGSFTPKESARDTRSAADFGVALFEALFQDEARDVVTRTLSRAGEKTAVLIRLRMDLQDDGMAEVASLPWELMCRLKGQPALALSRQTPVVRAVDTPEKTKLPPFRAPLRILVLKSNPSGSEKLNLGSERDAIESSWGRLPEVEVDFVRPVQAEILNKLAFASYHVIHYMGHGDFEANEGGKLLLEHENGSPHPVTGDVFAAWLRDAPLRLVFLNACKTGTTGVRSGAHPFAGIATALIRAGVPAVVAMQFPISDQAALLFSKTFYQRITEKFPVDAAVAEGRKALLGSKQTEWATPVLYLRSRDGALFEWGKDDAKVPRPQPGAATAPATATAAEDPWGPGEGLRVFLATPDQALKRTHKKLSERLNEDKERVRDEVPTDDPKEHAAAVDRLVRSADLCVHLLGANPGEPLGDDDDQPLQTYPLVELEIGRQAANSQLVVITREDKAKIGVKEYAALVDDDLGKQPREKERLELVVAEDKNRITDAVRAKLGQLKRARQAPGPPSAIDGVVRNALVDSHVDDRDSAIKLLEYLEGRNISTEMQLGSLPDAYFKELDETVKKSPLYIIVAGLVARDWVRYRKIAVIKAATKPPRTALLIARYSVEGADSMEVTRSRFVDISPLNDADRSWIDALFAPAAGD
jgi:hypothetical protein